MTLFLEQNGLDEVNLDGEDEISTVITKSERPYFKVHPDDFIDIEEISDVLTVVSIGNDQEWKFKGSKSYRKFSAIILDSHF